MAKVVNLTIARNVFQLWEEIQSKNPYGESFKKTLDDLGRLQEFKKLVTESLLGNLTHDNVDIICYVLEEYFPDLSYKLLDKSHIYYIKRRIDNAFNVINDRPLDEYTYAFPASPYEQKDSRVQFLMSVLDYVELMRYDDKTLEELWNTPLSQYEQMIQYISYFQHEKIPILLEKLSYYNKEEYALLTIGPIGQFKHRNSFIALHNLADFYMFKNSNILRAIYQTMQKLAFNRPVIE